MNGLIFTHELICEETRFFEDVNNFQDIISIYFEEIYDIQLVNSANSKKMIMVRGKLHLFGFLVSDGGFFDAYNGVYYDENSPLFKRANIYKIDYKKRIIN